MKRPPRFLRTHRRVRLVSLVVLVNLSVPVVGGGLNVVTNFAGSGAAGFVDNIGAAAQFNAPCQVALSPDGATLFVADRYNHRIRAVATAMNIVSTLAGSGSAGFSDATGTSASFSQPIGVTASPDGTTLFVGDFANHRIRSVTIATGAVATLAGSGSATAVDGTGAAASFNGPTGVVISPDGATVFVAEWQSHRIRLIVVATGAVSTLAGGTQGFTDGTGGSARFDNPNGVVVSPDGEMCIKAYYACHGAYVSAKASVLHVHTPATKPSDSIQPCCPI